MLKNLGSIVVFDFKLFNTRSRFLCRAISVMQRLTSS
jgi:hypothetical protein